ncbi:MAG: PIN domain-containing protein [Sphingomonadales bacterium]|nr:PIN domain-containing protein [Sphingomonadaceae bacterium]MBS3932202.1 PIN domain-containing protein [Sphingomonadales bacterium]
MTSFVDTSVLFELLETDAKDHQWCRDHIAKAKALGPVFVSDAAYSELSYGMKSVAEVDEAISALALARCGYTDAALFRAAKAFRKYKEENKGPKEGVLPDFFIGALAETEKKPLITRDTKKVSTYFPDLEIISPGS